MMSGLQCLAYVLRFPCSLRTVKLFYQYRNKIVASFWLAFQRSRVRFSAESLGWNIIVRDLWLPRCDIKSSLSGETSKRSHEHVKEPDGSKNGSYVSVFDCGMGGGINLRYSNLSAIRGCFYGNIYLYCVSNQLLGHAEMKSGRILIPTYSILIPISCLCNKIDNRWEIWERCFEIRFTPLKSSPGHILWSYCKLSRPPIRQIIMLWVDRVDLGKRSDNKLII